MNTDKYSSKLPVEEEETVKELLADSVHLPVSVALYSPNCQPFTARCCITKGHVGDYVVLFCLKWTGPHATAHNI